MQASEPFLVAFAACCHVLSASVDMLQPVLRPLVPFLPPVPVSDMLRPSRLRVSPQRSCMGGMSSESLEGDGFESRLSDSSTAITQIESTGPARPRPRRAAHASLPPRSATTTQCRVHAGSVRAHAGSMLVHADSWLHADSMLAGWLAGSMTPMPPFWPFGPPSFHAPALPRCCSHAPPPPLAPIFFSFSSRSLRSCPNTLV